jgi:tetratricopeptide (TPR) repeat protein
VNVSTPLTPGYPVYVSTTSAARGPTVTLIATTPPRAESPTVATQPARQVAAARPVASAVQQFLGMNELRPVNLAAAGPASGPSIAPSTNHFVARVANVESRRKAERMIAEADELFQAQNFHSALQRYKLAGTTAPDLAEAFWRQGHAFIATHNYELAARAFKRAIALSDDLGRGGFRLSDIYGGATTTKSLHLEELAEWAVAKRNTSDAYFLLGLFLEYDGQQARAEKFFQKAADLAGISGGHVAMFLDRAEPTLLTTIERTAAKPAEAKPAVTVPVVKISTGREL